jgi:amino acid transporter
VAFFVALAILNSVIAFVQAVFNGGARLLFAMGRAGVLPHGLSKVHQKFRTPHVAVAAILVLSAIVSYVLGFWRGEYAGLDISVTFGAVCFILIYIIGCAANIGFFLRRRRAEFSIFWNTIVPIIGIGVMAVALYKSVIPLPAYPGNYGVWAAYVWIFLGLVGVAWRGHRLSGDEFSRAMQLADESPDPLPERPSAG